MVWKDLHTCSIVSEGQCSLINVLFGLDYNGTTQLILIVHITDLFSMIYFTVTYIFQSEINVFSPYFCGNLYVTFFGLNDYVSCYMLKLIPVHIFPSYHSMYSQIPAFASVSN